MKSKSIQENFNELNKDNTIECSTQELEEFLYSGLIFKKDKGYVDKLNRSIQINTYTPKYFRFNIDLSGLIYECNKKCKENKINKIFCMTETCYNKYKNEGQIITKNGIEYYRLFKDEYWLIYLI